MEKSETPKDVFKQVNKFYKASPGNMLLTLLALFGLGSVAKNLKGN